MDCHFQALYVIVPFFFKDDHSNSVSVTKERFAPELKQFWGELGKYEHLLRRNSGFIKLVLSLTMFMLRWPGSVKSFGSVSLVVKLKWNGLLWRFLKATATRITHSPLLL